MVRITLLHAAPDTGNLGVAALGYAVIAGLARRIDDLSLTVADHGLGIRSESLSVDGRPFQYKRCGIRFSRHPYRPEALWNIRLAAGMGGAWNPIARHLVKQNFALDITGGDSFTDLYGPKRFKSCTQVKSLFLDQNIPLGLLPQTYGPFQDPERRAHAVDLIRRANFAWARDQQSYRVLRELLGSDFDPQLHHSGVDVAFLLEAVQPAATAVGAQAMNWFNNRLKPLVGINVSGLIYNDPEGAARQYGFVADYRQVIIEFVRKMLTQSDANVLLVPHVVVPKGHVESDMAACQDVCLALQDESHGRLIALPEFNDPRQVKWVISNCDWFCGTRMHATIAGLSTRVPTAAIAYSLKTAGVFETCGQGDHVADPRKLSTEFMVERLWHSWSVRDEAGQSLSNALPRVMDQADQQMDMIAASCQGRSAPTLVGGMTS